MTYKLEPGQATTLIHRSIGWGNNILENLPRILRLPSATLSKPSTRRAVIVGAGPSLEKNAHWLRLFDGLVIATNTAAPAVEAAGRECDVICAIESMDTTKRCTAKPRRWMLELQAHPAWFALAGDKAMWVSDQTTAVERMAADLATPQLIGGVAALTYAVAIALHWGMDEVVLIGADLSYPVDGPAYAKGTGWHDVTTKIVDGRYTVDNGEDRTKAAKDAGCYPDPGGEVFEAPAWDPAQPPVYMSHIFREQHGWLVNYPKRYPSTKFVNATEGGAAVAGWEPLEFKTLCAGAPSSPPGWRDVRVEPGRYALALRRLHRDALAYHAASILIGEASPHGPASIEGAHRWCPLADFFTTPDTLRISADTTLTPKQRIQQAYAAQVAVGDFLTKKAEELIAGASAA